MCFWHPGCCCWRACRASCWDVSCWNICWTLRARSKSRCPCLWVCCFTISRTALWNQTRWLMSHQSYYHISIINFLSPLFIIVCYHITLQFPSTYSVINGYMCINITVMFILPSTSLLCNWPRCCFSRTGPRDGGGGKSWSIFSGCCCSVTTKHIQVNTNKPPNQFNYNYRNNKCVSVY